MLLLLQKNLFPRCDLLNFAVVDSYAVAVDGECLAQVRGSVVAVIDDLADRLLPVDLVINGAIDAHRLAYQTRPGTRLLLGPDYVLLREEFATEPKRPIRERIEIALHRTASQCVARFDGRQSGQGDISHGRQGKSAAFGRAHVVGWISCFRHLATNKCWRLRQIAEQFQFASRHRPISTGLSR